MTENANPAADKPIDHDKISIGLAAILPDGATHFLVIAYQDTMYVAGDMDRDTTVEACMGILKKAGIHVALVKKAGNPTPGAN